MIIRGMFGQNILNDRMKGIQMHEMQRPKYMKMNDCLQHGALLGSSYKDIYGNIDISLHSFIAVDGTMYLQSWFETCLKT